MSFIPRSLNGEDFYDTPEDAKFESINQMSAGYREVIELQQATTLLKEQGYDTSDVMYTVRHRNTGYGSGSRFTSDKTINGGGTALAWYSTGSQSVVLPTTDGPLQTDTGFSIGGGSNRNNAIHETFHAMHDQKLGQRGPYRLETLDMRSSENIGRNILAKVAPDFKYNPSETASQLLAGRIGNAVWEQASGANFIRGNVSKYGQSAICEFVAEAGTMKVAQPKYWKESQNNSFNPPDMSNALEGIRNDWSGRISADDLAKIQQMNISLADLYEYAGGP